MGIRTNPEIRKRIVQFLSKSDDKFLEMSETYKYHEETFSLSVGETMRLDNDSIAFQEVWMTDPDAYGLTQVVTFTKDGVDVTNVLHKKEKIDDPSGEDKEGVEGV